MALREESKETLRVRVTEWVRSAFTDNPVPKTVAFFLALAIFILVQSDEGVYVGVDVRVEYNLPADRVLVNQLPNQIEVVVKGTRRQTRRFSGNELKPIRVDLTNHRGSNYDFVDNLLRLPEGVSLVRFEPASIPTNFEDRIEKQVPIEVERRGSAPPGYLVAQTTVSPDEARISGAASAVADVSVVKTREVSLLGKKEGFRQTVGLQKPHPYVELLEPQAVTVDLNIVEEQASKRLGPVGVSIRHGTPAVAARFRTDPAQVVVVVRGTRLAIDALQPNQLVAYVQLFTDDVSSRRTRQARVIVPKPAPGIAVEIYPEEVTLQHK